MPQCHAKDLRPYLFLKQQEAIADFSWQKWHYEVGVLGGPTQGALIFFPCGYCDIGKTIRAQDDCGVRTQSMRHSESRSLNNWGQRRGTQRQESVCAWGCVISFQEDSKGLIIFSQCHHFLIFFLLFLLTRSPSLIQPAPSAKGKIEWDVNSGRAGAIIFRTTRDLPDGLEISSCYWWENWSSELDCNLPRVTGELTAELGSKTKSLGNYFSRPYSLSSIF